LSDFGHADEFVGVVHGVVARIAPDVRLIDVGHGVPRGNIRAGALSLLRAIQYLPNGVILAVVDPGVGTARRPVAAATPWGYFVGPDNGLLAPAVAMVGGVERAVVLEAPDFQLPSEGATFAGRDVFAPAAAVLASGEAELSDLGGDIDPASLTPLLLPLVDHGDGVVQGEVWWIDGFGNAQTNVTPEDLGMLGLAPGSDLMVRVGSARHPIRWVEAYGDVEEGRPLVHVDSYGQMAIAVRGGRADEVLNLHDRLSIGFSPPTLTPPTATG
jgi:S-adenosylmethionine hydrolase